MLAIKNGKIILEDRIIENKILLLTDKIEGIVEENAIPDGATVVDCNGGYITPGFIDLHIHGYLGKDVCDANAESIRTIAGGLVENGVTGFLPTTMTVDMKVIEGALNACREVKNSGEYYGSSILGVHAEGPFISASKKGAQDERYILKPNAEFVKANEDIIRIITLAPEEDKDFAEIRRMAEETDVVVSMGHTSADYKTAMESTKNGIKHTTHLFNAMTPMIR